MTIVVVAAAVLVALAGAVRAFSQENHAKPRPRHERIVRMTPPPLLAARPIPHHPVAPPSGIPITMLPAGLSVEYQAMARDLGGKRCGATGLVTVLRALGSPPLRLGGNSQDLTSSLTKPGSSSLSALPSSFWKQLGCVLAKSPDPLTVGVNAKRGTSAEAAQLVGDAWSSALHNVTVSIGNEPDLYSGDKADVKGNSLSYLKKASALQEATGIAPLLGPDLAVNTRWRPELPILIRKLGLAEVGVHLYPLGGCESTFAPTLQELLSERVAESPASLSWVVADSSAAGIPALISEANSVSCGGEPGVSDQPASAVWAVRFALSALETGFKEVRFHSSGGAYDPFVVSEGHVVVRPVGEAISLLNHWLPVGSYLQKMTKVRGIDAVSVLYPRHRHLALLTNYNSRAETIRVESADPLSSQELGASWAGERNGALQPVAGWSTLTIPPNSVVALSSHSRVSLAWSTLRVVVPPRKHRKPAPRSHKASPVVPHISPRVTVSPQPPGKVTNSEAGGAQSGVS